MKKRAKEAAPAPPAPAADRLDVATPRLTLTEKLFALLAGLWIGLSFLKFGNPIILDRMIPPPKDWTEFVFTPWPVAWGYALLAVVLVSGLSILKPRFAKHHWPIAVLGFWLVWQFLSSARSIQPRLTNPVMVHFVTCAVSFLLGWWGLTRFRFTGFFWAPVLASFFYVLVGGFDQHAGGLESTRKAFYAQTNWQLYPREYILKIESNRIFSTLVYPNALAGLILLLLPVALWQTWGLTARWPRVLRGVLVGLLGYLGLACLYWTGSKGGWLVALVMVAALVLQTRIPPRIKGVLVAAGLVLGLAAFFLRFSGYFQKGATSVGARFVYWSAAVQIAKTHPLLGSGPGTFSMLFQKLKPPEAEMAKLVHNDYLQQASDSGLPGALAFLTAIGASLTVLYRYSKASFPGDLLFWVGLLGWCLQAFIEFALYIPALAWPTFLFMGMLWGLDPKIRER